MSFMFEHWFEDEYENITKGEVRFLQRENEELKRRVKELEGGISRKKGRWIKSINPGYSPFDHSGEYIWTCSECGFKQTISDKLNYCPNCGADMREVLNSET